MLVMENSAVYGIKIEDYFIRFKINILFFPSFLVVTRQEFRVEFQFTLIAFDCDDEGHILFLKVTVLTLLVDRLIIGTHCSSCAIDMYGKFTAC